MRNAALRQKAKLCSQLSLFLCYSATEPSARFGARLRKLLTEVVPRPGHSDAFRKGDPT